MTSDLSFSFLYQHRGWGLGLLCHIWAIWIRATVKSMVFEQFRFCFGWTVFATSVVSGKQLLWDRGDFGSLV